MIQLGTKVTDSITKFTGTAVARCELLHGVPSILVQPEFTANTFAKSVWFDEERLSSDVAPVPTPTKVSGFAKI